MNRLFLLTISLQICLLTAPVFAQDNPIVQRMSAFTTAYNAGDAAAVAAIYAEDSALLPPRQGAALGREAIGAIYAGAFAAGVSNLRVKTLEIRQHGDKTVVEIGETSITVGGRDIRSRYVHVWVLEDEVWMLSRDIYNVIGAVN